MIIKENAMRKYLLEVHGWTKNDGGSKAINDVNYFLKKLGFVSIQSPNSKVKKALYLLTKFPHEIKKLSGIIVVQFTGGKLQKRIAKVIKKNERLKLIYIIHDLEALRYNADSHDPQLMREEINLMKEADGIVSLSQPMTDWLRKQGVQCKISNLGMWDYFTTNFFVNEDNYNHSVCFAGNLNKSDFLRTYTENQKISCYGTLNNVKLSSNLIYKGVFSPEAVSQKIKENFGLIWDGNSSETCSGKAGEYLKYNSPHKTALYLSSGIPVIVWENAAVAEYVKKYNCGILIKSLNEIDIKLKNITQDQYKKLVHNAQFVGKQMRKGMFLQDALENLM